MTSSKNFRRAVVMLALLAGALFVWAYLFRPASPPASDVIAPSGMVYVPGGEFLTGSETYSSDPDVGPLRTAYVGPFFIDKTEVSHAAVKAVWPEHKIFHGQEAMPATELSWNQAVDVLSRMGKRLPTSLEWEKASRGQDGRVFPWGNDPKLEGRAHVGMPNKDHTRCGFGELLAVTANPDGASPYGLLNAVGNAWEFMGDQPTSTRPYHLIRGGAYGYPPINNRLDTVTYEQPGST